MKSKIGMRIFVYMFCVAIVPMALLFGYISSNYYDNLEENIYYENTLLQQSSVNELDATLNKIEFTSNVCFDLGIQDILSKDIQNALENYTYLQQIERIFRVNLELFKVFDVLDAVKIENSFGNSYIIQQENDVTYSFPELEIEKDMLKQRYKNFDIITTDTGAFVYVRLISGIRDVGTDLGIVSILFEKDKLLESFEGYTHGNRGYLTIENEVGNVIYTSVPKEISQQTLSSTMRRSEFSLENSKFKVIYYDNVNLLLSPVRELQKITLILMGVSILVVVILGFVLASNLTISIRQLKRGISKVADGNYDVNIKIKRKDELGELCDTFNLMANRMDVLINEVLTSKLTEKEAVISALTAQINPHFLYNTLDMVKSMAEIEGQDEIGEIAKALSGIFRYSTKNDVLVVPVQEEIKNLKNYIKIIDARFDKKIRFQLDVDEDVLYCEMIKLCLQPLVENSINHGLSHRGNEGEIHVAITKQGTHLIIKVEDNGEGIEPIQLQNLQEELEDYTKKKNTKEDNRHTSIGLQNIHRRIRLYYGEEYGLHIESQYLEGTSVMIRMPL
ncbi:histidine kinase [Vallitaleaceae bacterium 9-2]